MSADYDRTDLAAWLRDWRLQGCEHEGFAESACAPCMRDRLFVSDWLAHHDTAIAARARAQAGEDVAQAIEADMRVRPLAGHDGIRDAAIIARDTTKAGQ